MQTKIVLATGNSGKVKEMAGLLAEFGSLLVIVPQTELHVSEVEETGTTFVENAIIKARHAAFETGLPAIADDSGLEVDYLNGAPGVYSSRFAGVGASDLDNLKLLLHKLDGVNDEQRTARFHCVLVYMRHHKDPTPVICHASWEGRIMTRPSGEHGFGYDPIFIPNEQNISSAELAPELKKKISHRGQALIKLKAALQGQL